MLESQPLVSIIIPTRNRKDLLVNAVHSVLAQTYIHLQIIVHDNFSTDGTGDFIRETFSDPRIEYYRTMADLSMTENWNAAFGKITGEYFLRLDDDNVISNDFVEIALKEMVSHRYDVVIYSPLIVNLYEKVTTIFEPDQKVLLLTKFEEVYLEYFNYIDSNYALYKTKLVQDLFPDGNVYQTTLPDRYMGYRMMSMLSHIKVGFSTALKGITRFDYRAPYGTEYELTYVDYDGIDMDLILKEKDCLNNFHMHRVSTLAYFLHQSLDLELIRFFNKAVIHPDLYRTLMKIGHIYMARDAYTWNEFVIYNRYVIEIVFSLLCHPFDRFEGRNMIINMIAIGRNVVLANIRSMSNLFFRKKRLVLIPSAEKGNAIVQQLIAGNLFPWYSQQPEYGNVGDMLEKITRISQKVNYMSANISEWISPSIFDWSYLTLKPLLSEIKKYSRQLELEETETILDLGCGIKPYISLFPFAKKYIGFDIVAGPEVDVVGKNWELPFRDNEFDALLTTQVLEHTARISETVLEIKRVVKKDGLIFVSAPMTYPEHEVPYDYFRFTRYGLQEIFKDFEIVSITSSGGFIHTMFKLVNVFVNYFPYATYWGAPFFLVNNVLGVIIDFCFSILNGMGNATLQKFYDIYMRMPENFMIVIRNTKE